MRTTLVIFGGTGNLTHIKLVPAIHEIYKTNPDLAVIGLGRRELTDEAFREGFRNDILGDTVDAFLSCFSYIRGDINDKAVYDSLKAKLQGEDAIFYLAVSPVFILDIISQLGEAGLSTAEKRIIIEKPFGEDEASAKSLYDNIEKVFTDKQIYIIDHYLGKETVQNLLSFRFANGIFEQMWNSEHIDSIQIQVQEEVGIGQRGEYYDKHGATKDMLQSHLLQILAAITIEPPLTMTAEEIGKKRIDLLQSLRIPSDNTSIVFGQYVGYKSEQAVAENSATDTFVAMKTYIDNDRWRNVPIYFKTGKKLQSHKTEVFIQFKESSISPVSAPKANFLAFRIQPNPGITFGINIRKPGEAMEIKDITMDFCYDEMFTVSDNSYIRLISDAIKQNKFLFTSIEEILASWRFVDPIVTMRDSNPVSVQEYNPGTEGPNNALSLPEADNRTWLSIFPYKCDIRITA